MDVGGDGRVRDEAGDPVDGDERVGAEALHLGGVEEAVDLAAGAGEGLLGMRLLGGDVEQAALEAEADEPEEAPVDPAATGEDVAEEADHRLRRPAQDPARHDHRGPGVRQEELRGAQAVGDDGQRLDVGKLLGEVVAGRRGVHGDDVPGPHELGGALGDGPLGAGGDPVAEVEGALVGAGGDQRPSADPAQHGAALKALEVLADGDRGDPEAGGEGADLDAAVVVELEQDGLFAVELTQ